MTPTDAPPAVAVAAEAVSSDVEITDRDAWMMLAGPGGTRLPALEQACGVGAALHGDRVRLHGAPQAVALAERVVSELLDTVQSGATLEPNDVTRSAELLAAHPDMKLREIFKHVIVRGAEGREITPRGLAQKHYVQSIRSHDIVFGIGPAGTGKTYLAMAMAVASLQANRVRRIILTRPAVEAGEKLGFLPGDMTEKVNPYLRPLYDALYDMMAAERAQQLLQRGVIEVAPLAFMRGRSLNDSFIILDEGQNTSIAQMKMFLTRVGLRSKAVITGDVTQVDLPRDTDSGLADAVSLLDAVDGLQVCHFSSADVVRHALVQRVVDAYDARDQARARAGGDDGQR
jgi:phosphate starvation-inducible PhoH-like protein